MIPSSRSLLACCVIVLSLLSVCDSFQRYKMTTGILRKLPILLCTNSADSEMNWDPKAGPKLDFNEDYYSVLDVDSKVEPKELKKAYYKLVFKYHPDNIENESSKSLCNKQMMVINGAYRILKNIDLRVLYDKQRRKGLVGVAAGIKDSSAKTAASSTTRPASEAAGRQDERQKVPPKTANQDASKGKKYSGSGFGGSWTTEEANKESDDEVEQEYLDQERERERQRQRYQEPQPQTQRQRDQQVRDRDREFDFTYDQGGVFTGPNRTPWGFNVNSDDTPVRPTDRYRDEASDIDKVEEFLRRSGRGSSSGFDSSVRDLKERLENLCIRKVTKEREMARMSAEVRDWGEVTDVRLIRKRIEDINEINSLTMQISDLSDDIADKMLRSSVPQSQGNTRRDEGQGQAYRPPVDLWGETQSRAQPPRVSTRPPPRTVTPPRPATKRAPEPGSIDWDKKRNVKGDDAFKYNFDEDSLDDFGEKKDDSVSDWRKSRRRFNPESNGSGQAFASFLFEDEIEEETEDMEEEESSAETKNNAVLNELLRIFKDKNKRKK